MLISDINTIYNEILNNIQKVIIGKNNIIEKIFISLLCKSHVLLEDVPGTGKTVLAKCLAKSVDGEFKRIQFTPDLLPSDLTGINFFNQKESEFVYRPGPIFANIIIADEINRATPRTQSSLLECMEEKQVTVDGVTRPCPMPFFVIATQNPVETHGTFPLPEAQLDRFLMRLEMGYPTRDQDIEILERFEKDSPIESIESVVTIKDIIEAQDSFVKVQISSDIKRYIVDIVGATRKSEKVALGVSPRGSIMLMKAAQARAAIRGRDYVTPEDVKSMAVPCLSHRIILKGFAITGGTKAVETVVNEIIDSIIVPTEEY